jgi:hypothetical protein
VYSSDAVLVTGPDRQVRGRGAITTHYAELLLRHPMASIHSSAVETGCKDASVTGLVLLRVTGARKGTRMVLAGRFRAELEYQHGKWLITRHELSLSPRALQAIADAAF